MKGVALSLADYGLDLSILYIMLDAHKTRKPFQHKSILSPPYRIPTIFYIPAKAQCFNQ